MALRFEHRDTEIGVSIVDRVWHTRSGAGDTMTSAARTCWQLIFSRTHKCLLAGLRGPETRATTAPAVVEALGYFDQAHLARSLRRYVGRTARELREGDQASMSFLYKTHPGPGS